MPRKFIFTDSDEPMRCGICILDRPINRNYEDALLQHIEDFFEKAAFAREALDEIGEVDRVERIESAEDAIKRGVFFNRHQMRL